MLQSNYGFLTGNDDLIEILLEKEMNHLGTTVVKMPQKALSDQNGPDFS